METEQPNSHENRPEQGVPPLRATSGAKVNADVRTENERCGTKRSKGATAMRMPGFGDGNETAEQP